MNWTRIGSHVSFWLVYLMLNTVLTCIMHRLPLPDSLPTALAGELMVLPLKLALTYFVFYFIIPLYLDRNKLVPLVALTLAAFAVVTIAYRFILADLYFPMFRPERKISVFFGQGIYLTAFDFFITVAAATTVKMIRMHYKSREFEKQLLREKLQSELNFLRAQTNPHFLFNTLNNLYVLARKKSDLTPDAIMMLSKIMRFMLYDCRASRIRLSDESKVIQDYIELEKLRYNERLTVAYHEDIDQPGAAIAPLLLLPFVENSFKHGANSTTGDAEIRIRLQLFNNELDFFVENTAEEPAHAQGNGSDGIGLQNVQRQLDLIYPTQHKLAIERENGWYKAHLNICLSEN